MKILFLFAIICLVSVFSINEVHAEPQIQVINIIFNDSTHTWTITVSGTGFYPNIEGKIDMMKYGINGARGQFQTDVNGNFTTTLESWTGSLESLEYTFRVSELKIYKFPKYVEFGQFPKNAIEWTITPSTTIAGKETIIEINGKVNLDQSQMASLVGQIFIHDKEKSKEQSDRLGEYQPINFFNGNINMDENGNFRAVALVLNPPAGEQEVFAQIDGLIRYGTYTVLPNNIDTDDDEIPEVEEKLDEIGKINLENEYSPKERESNTSGPFQIDRNQYAIGEKIFIVIDGLDVNEKGQIAIMRPLNDVDYSVYLTIPFDGSVKPAFNYYVEPQISKTNGIYSVDDLLGEWLVVFRGTDYPNLNFEITEDVVSGTYIGSVSNDLPNEITIKATLGSGSSPGCEETSQGCFIPKSVSVAAGGTVIFSNPDTVAHTFTAGTAADGPSGEFDSSLVIVGSSYEWTPTTQGQYDYFCMLHPWMTGIIFVGEGTYIPPTEDDFDLHVIMENQVYDLSDTAIMNLSIDGTSTSQNVALEISDPRGTTVISRSFEVDSQGVSFEFRIDENFKTGTYKVVATTSNNGNTVSDTVYFKVISQYNSFKITSVQVTDQQGNPSNLQKGEIGFIKVNLEANKSITTLVTVNLFDSDLTSIGIGSIKTTLSSGNSEIILSFMIPSDVSVGPGNIYVNAFSDWPSNGGIPLTGEISIMENIE